MRGTRDIWQTLPLQTPPLTRSSMLAALAGFVGEMGC